MEVFVVVHTIHAGVVDLWVYADGKSAKEKAEQIIKRSYGGLDYTYLENSQRWIINGTDALIEIKKEEVLKAMNVIESYEIKNTDIGVDLLIVDPKHQVHYLTINDEFSKNAQIFDRKDELAAQIKRAKDTLELTRK